MPIAVTIILALLTLASFAGALTAWRRPHRDDGASPRSAAPQRIMMLLVALTCSCLYAYRWLGVNQGVPIETHADGLLLIAGLLAWALLYLDMRSAMRGLNAFGLWVLGVLLLWAVCASAWTFHPFAVDSIINAVHTVGVYLGGLFLVIAASAGLLYLASQRRLHRKSPTDQTNRSPSLESTERLIIRSSAIGLSLMSVGLVTGLVMVAQSAETPLGADWWTSPKVLLAAATWLVYAMVTNVRHSSFFRGARAAWLAIVGLVMFMTVFALATMLPTTQAPNASPSTPSALQTGEAP